MGVRLFLLCIGSFVAIYIAYIQQETPFDPDAVRGKNVLITGASSGIGEQLAYHYAKHEANVVITARREHQLRRVVSQCKRLGAESHFGYIVADMGEDGASKHVIQKAVESLGHLDHLILNHAYMPPALAWSPDEDSLRNLHRALDINVKSTAFALAHAIPYLEQRGGSVAIINSMMGKICRPYFAPYCASKFALDGFVQGVRLELENKHISITNCILGLIGTDAAKEIVKDMTVDFHVDTRRLESNSTFADPSDTAYQIMRATSLKEKDLVYPPQQWLRLKITLRDLIVWMGWNKGPQRKTYI